MGKTNKMKIILQIIALALALTAGVEARRRGGRRSGGSFSRSSSAWAREPVMMETMEEEQQTPSEWWEYTNNYLNDALNTWSKRSVRDQAVFSGEDLANSPVAAAFKNGSQKIQSLVEGTVRKM